MFVIFCSIFLCTISFCRYYTEKWISEVAGRVRPHEDIEVSDMRNKCFRKIFPNPEDVRKIKQQFADFSLFGASFDDRESIEDLNQSNGGAFMVNTHQS
jgi:hypothetical protein